jgi:hypothetical protein
MSPSLFFSFSHSKLLYLFFLLLFPSLWSSHPLISLHIPLLSLPYPHVESPIDTPLALNKVIRVHCTENTIYVFPEKKLLGLVPNSCIHVCVIDLLIPRIGLPIWLQQNRQTNPGNKYIAHRYMNVEIGRQDIIILFWK